MIINSTNSEKKIALLAKNVAELILSGIKTENILILAANSFKKEKISEKIYDILFTHNCNGFGALNIFTFSGIAYNSVSKNWITIEKLLSAAGGDTGRRAACVCPVFC